MNSDQSTKANTSTKAGVQSRESIYQHGFARIAAVTIPVHIADPHANGKEIVRALHQVAAEGACVAVFPELSVSGYALDELLLQDTLLEQVEATLADICAESAALNLLTIVGAPLQLGTRLYNCAVFISQGKVQLITPKTYLPNYREFYDKRYFASAKELLPGEKWDSVVPGAKTAPIGSIPLKVAVGEATRQLNFQIGAEVCEDMWVPVPPSTKLALAGAQIIVNLSGSPVTVGRARRRKLMCASLAARNQCAYVYTASGNGESSTDLSWDGQTLIYQEETLLAKTARFPQETAIAYADINIKEIDQSRLVQGSFHDCAYQELEVGENLRSGKDTALLNVPTVVLKDPLAASPDSITSASSLNSVKETAQLIDSRYQLRPRPSRFPFMAGEKASLDTDCYEAYNIQVYALLQRLKAIGNPKIVIGVSGGLDSTHALIVAAQAVDRLGLDRSHILAFTMPGFATSAETKNNAYRLCEALGILCEEIDIRPAALQMLKDMGHEFSSGKPVYDVTFENVQAGLRTDYLFRLANQRGGIVLGTGDLSELALGWCTYGVGDQMSHYGINAGVPKTMIQHLIHWVAAQNLFGEECSAVLRDILAQEISPELIPVQAGEKMQSTQDTIGPYELHDFFLYYFLRGYSPRTILFLAEQAWSDNPTGEWLHSEKELSSNCYSRKEILHWLREFVRRFFGAQFKRTAMPNGPKVFAGGSLSPRGDWRMPSDASRKAWIAQLDALAEELD